MGRMDQIYHGIAIMRRRKHVDPDYISKLDKTMRRADLIVLGISSTLGAGVYVLLGDVCKYHAGPAIIVSLFWAALAALLSGLGYAEFAARVPKIGSAYIYCYIGAGEFIAFFVGWSLILEYALGAAVVTKGMYEHLDYLLDGKMSHFFLENMHLPDFLQLARYPDLVSAIIVMIFAVAMAFGAKQSARVNRFSTAINLGVILAVIFVGITAVNYNNWSIPAMHILNEGVYYGNGGFIPYGFTGIMRGAAACFFAFIGFDAVAAAVEEAVDPTNIPKSIFVSIGIVFICYVLVGAVLTLMMPYYKLTEQSTLPAAFDFIGYKWAKYIVSLGAILALLSNLYGVVFPLPRMIYSMANDGLLFEKLSAISSKRHTPVAPTITAGFLTAILVLIFEVEHLIYMLSLGSLLAYTAILTYVIMLRFQPVDEATEPQDFDLSRICCQIFNTNRVNQPTYATYLIVRILTSFMIPCSLIATMWLYAYDQEEGSIFVSCVSIISLLMFICVVFAINRQPRNHVPLLFKMPCVPWLPGFGVLLNCYLIVSLNTATQIRFAIWCIVGLFIYVFYSVKHSKERGNEYKHRPAMHREAFHFSRKKQSKSVLSVQSADDSSKHKSRELMITDDDNQSRSQLHLNPLLHI